MVTFLEKELNKKINESKILISFNQAGYNPISFNFPKNYKIGMHLKAKIFEPILCKTFVLSEEIENMERFYEPNKELVSFKDKFDLVEKNKILSYEQFKKREQIALASYNKTIKFLNRKSKLKKCLI